MGPFELRENRRVKILGLIGIGIIAAIVYLSVTVHTGLPFATTTIVKAAFHDVHSVHAGNDVRQNSVSIGLVKDVQYADGQAIVTLKLSGDRKVYRDARAKIADFSALGTKFVELDPGTPAAGPLGNSVIPPARDADSADIYQVYDIFDPHTLDTFTSTVRNVGGGAAGHSADLSAFTQTLPGLLHDTGTVSETLASPDADLPRLLQTAHQLSARFLGQQAHISNTVGQTSDTLRALSVDNSVPLSQTLNKLPTTLDDAQAAFDRLNAPLSDTLTFATTVEPGAQGLGQATPDLRGVLREGTAPLGKVPDVADDAKPAVSDLTDTFSDARPLAPKLARAFNDLATPIQALAPYADEMGELFVRGDDWTSEQVDGRHYARLTVDPSVRTVGGLILSHGEAQDNYPAPGQAQRDRMGLTGAHR